jgi:hypothetical protein
MPRRQRIPVPQLQSRNINYRIRFTGRRPSAAPFLFTCDWHEGWRTRNEVTTSTSNNDSFQEHLQAEVRAAWAGRAGQLGRRAREPAEPCPGNGCAVQRERSQALAASANAGHAGYSALSRIATARVRADRAPNHPPRQEFWSLEVRAGRGSAALRQNLTGE